MPVKNTEKYLEACLDSILAQTLKEWELIAVDDHSTDESRAIIERYASEDKMGRITVLSNKGQGIISALRTAYIHTRGRYITRMDSDDIMSENKLELFANKVEQLGVGHIITGYVHYFNDYDTKVGKGYRNYADWLNLLSSDQTNYDEIYKECSIASPNWMVHRQDLDTCQAFLPDIYPEDYDLCFRFREAGLKVATVKEVTHHWRDYPNRTSRTDDNYKDNRFTALKIHHFIKSDYKTSNLLILWGAGPKGKAIAKELIANNLKFQWITDNQKKIGKDIYGLILQDAALVINSIQPVQYIIGISQRGAQSGILERLSTIPKQQIFFFC